MAVTDCRVCATPLPADARFCMTCGVDVTDPGATVRTSPRDQTAELQDRLTRTLAGRYDVKKLLGAGGMAAVFLADEIGLDRPVAIKVLPPELTRDESLVARFQREAKTSAKLDHPHIIPIYRVESEGGLHYFVMKYVAGRSLESLLESKEAMPIDLATRILREAALALGHAHARGVVHRDVKPANIMLDQDGRVVLTDFGISKAGESTQLTQTGMIIGTPDYMAPEQALGIELDGRADQYALGVVAYEMLTRQCPFSGGSAHTLLYRHIHEIPKPVAELRPDVPAHLGDAVAMRRQKHEPSPGVRARAEWRPDRARCLAKWCDDGRGSPGAGAETPGDGSCFCRRSRGCRSRRRRRLARTARPTHVVALGVISAAGRRRGFEPGIVTRFGASGSAGACRTAAGKLRDRPAAPAKERAEESREERGACAER